MPVGPVRCGRFIRGTNSWGVLEAVLRGGSGVSLKLREGEAPYPPKLRPVDDVMDMPVKSVLHVNHPPSWIAQVRAILTNNRCGNTKTLADTDTNSMYLVDTTKNGRYLPIQILGHITIFKLAISC